MATNSSWLTIPQRLGSETEVLRTALWQLACELKVAAPGIVQSFDAAQNTATVRLAIMENINVNTPDGQGGAAPVPTPTPVAVLLDVPVMMYGGGGWSVTAPVAAGDECLVVFGDCCINSWWFTGGQPIPGGGGTTDKAAVQEERRRHDLSDAMAIVGLRSLPRAIGSYSSDHLQIRNDAGTISISIGADGITITPDGGVTKVTIAPNLITMTSTIVNVVGTLEVNGVPVTVP